MKIYLAQMQWCERDEPIIAGTNKRKVLSDALKILKKEHGTGSIDRGAALCQMPITADDVEIVEIPFLSNHLRDKERLDWLEKSEYELYEPNTDSLFSESSRAAIDEAMHQTAT
jgi:hypothetical protein